MATLYRVRHLTDCRLHEVVLAQFLNNTHAATIVTTTADNNTNYV
jgi:hypothetical protein